LFLSNYWINYIYTYPFCPDFEVNITCDSNYVMFSDLTVVDWLKIKYHKLNNLKWKQRADKFQKSTLTGHPFKNTHRDSISCDLMNISSPSTPRLCQTSDLDTHTYNIINRYYYYYDLHEIYKQLEWKTIAVQCTQSYCRRAYNNCLI